MRPSTVIRSGVFGGVRFHDIGRNDRCRTTLNLPHRDVQQEDGGLKNVQADHRLHQIASRDDHVETGHHQKDDNPVIVKTQDGFEIH